MKLLTHKSISLFKSLLRISGYTLLILSTQSLVIFFVFSVIILAELIGVAEEFFQ